MKFYAKSKKNSQGYKPIGTMSVKQHCIDVGLVTKFILTDYNPCILELVSKKLKAEKTEVLQMFSLFSSLHDVGKVHLYFQMNFENAVQELLSRGLISQNFVNEFRKSKYTDNYRVRHEVVTRKILLDECKNYKKNSLFRGLVYALSSHHEKDNNSTKRNPSILEGTDLFFDEKQNELIKDLHKIFLFDWENLNKFSKDKTDSICMVFFFILIASDWVASSYLDNNIEKFDECDRNNNLDDFIEFRENQIRNIFDNELGLINRKSIDLSDFSKIFGTKNYILRPLQKKMEEICKNKKIKFFIVEGPMGEGKTETALYAAGHMMGEKPGIFFGLPTGVTSFMMNVRLKRIFENQKVSNLNVLYSNSFLEEKLYEAEVEDSLDLLKSSRTGMLVENVVGTVDQLMLAVVKSKFSILRLLGLINKVIIIDEVHAYDSYMQSIIYRFLEWASELEIPVILLSATLSKKVKSKLVESYFGSSVELKKDSYPLITCITEDNEIKEYVVESTYMQKNFEWNFLRLEEDRLNLLRKVQDKVGENKNIGVVCNTVRESREIYDLLSSNLENYDIVLLHSNFKVKDRKEKEEYIKSKLGKENRKQNLIVIGTQVLEQSLDIDFDVLFTYLAPKDLLLQRVGRCHRFEIDGRDSSPEVYVILPLNPFEYIGAGYERIYNEYILRKTEEYLLNHPICSLPKDFRSSIEEVYGDIDIYDIENKEVQQKYFKFQVEQDTLRDLGYKAVIKKPQGSKFQRESVYSPFMNELEIEDFGTRLCIPKKKVIFVTEKVLKDLGLELFDLVKLHDIEKVRKLMEYSFSIPYYDLAVLSDELSSEGVVDCEGMLKGYRVFLMEDIVNGEKKEVNLEDNKGQKIEGVYYYTKEKGFICEK